MNGNEINMWDTHIWMFREVWAVCLIVVFAYPLHELSNIIWNWLRRRATPLVPRQSRLDIWVIVLAIQIVLVLFYLTKFLTF